MGKIADQDVDNEIVARRVRAQQVQLLYAQGPLSLLGSVVNLFFLAFLFREQAPALLLNSGIAATLSLYAVRYLLVIAFRRRWEMGAATDVWARYFLWGTVATGAAWGVFTFLLFPYATPLHLGLMVIIVGGLSAASIAVYAAVRGVSAAFILSAMLPLGFRVMAEGGELYITLGILILLFVVVLLTNAVRSHEVLANSLRLAEEQGLLAAHFRDAQEHSNDLVYRLKRENEERSRVEAELTENQQRYRHAQRLAGFGFWEYDLDSQGIIWSDEVFNIFALDPERVRPNLQLFGNCLHPDDREAVFERIRQALEGDGRFHSEHRIVRPDGSIRYVTDEGDVLYSGKQPVMMRGVVHDITERVAAEQDLRRSEGELLSILGNLQDTFYRTNLQGEFTYLSPQIEKALGYRPEELIGHPVSEIYVEPEVRDVLLERLQQEGEVKHFDNALYHKDGHVVWGSANLQFYFDEQGNIAGIEGLVRDITPLKKAEEELRRSEQELKNILTNMKDTFYRTNLAGEVTYITPQVEKVLGYRMEELLGTPLADLYIETGGRERFLREMEAHAGELNNFETALRHRDGYTVWLSTNAHFYYDDEGHIAGVEGNTRDITELKRAQEALQREQQRALVTLESIGDAVLTTDIEGNVEYLNPVAEKLVAIEGNPIGRRYSEVLPLEEEDSGELLDDLVELTLHHDASFVNASNGLLHHPNGGEFVLKVSTAAMRDSEGQVIGAVLVLHDITETMEMTRLLNYQAGHDTLTGLVNRREFERHLSQAIHDSVEHGSEHALFFMDLDQFKVVNDTCGHRAGDELLKQLSLQLDGAVRHSDVLARLGGDEFAVLLEHCPLDMAHKLADKLRQLVKEFRFVWEEKSFEIGVSIGVVPISANSGSVEQLLSAADAACYFAKDLGRNRVFLYHEEGTAPERHGEMSWVHRITEAFENDWFRLDAQLIAPLHGSEARPHYEVLLRMRDEAGHVIPPMAFIPAAERYNLMPTIDRWVIRTTLGMLREAQAGNDQPPLICSINLSGQSLADEHCYEFIIDQLELTGLDPASICFEVTETAAITNLTRAMELIGELKRRGCLFSLDDFGSGLSSFGYLKNLPVDFLKIDGSFVRDILDDEIDRAMVEAIHRVGSVMELKTIGEFVENDGIAEQLRQIGVDYAQGYGIARPEPLEVVLQRYTPRRVVTGS